MKGFMMTWVERGKTVHTKKHHLSGFANIKRRVRMGHCSYIAKNTYTWTKVLAVVLCFNGLCYIIPIDVTHPIWFQWTQADLAMVQDGIGTSVVKTPSSGKGYDLWAQHHPNLNKKKTSSRNWAGMSTSELAWQSGSFMMLIIFFKRKDSFPLIGLPWN